MQPSLDFPYTEAETPESRARIGADLTRIVERASAADRHLVALVLTGGFSRGEGTFRDGAPVNDYDLVAVRRLPGGDALLAPVAHALTEEIGIEVDLLPVWRGRLRRVGRKLFWLDLRLGGRVIAGDPSVLSRIPDFSVSHIEPGEASRLLGNRAAGLILALPPAGAMPDERVVALQSAKAAIAAMDARLLANGLYAPKLRERLTLAQALPDADVFARAVQWKLVGGEPVAWDAARSALLRAVEDTDAARFADGWTERAFHLLKAKRIKASPSRDIRREAWGILRNSQIQQGLAPGVKDSFFAARSQTLQ